MIKPIFSIDFTDMFTLTPLNYDYNDLEPHIDARTMQIHYEKHFAGYLNKMNQALEEGGYAPASIKEVVTGLWKENDALRNHGGGYYNHMLFFEHLAPDGGGVPQGQLGEAIERDFGHYEEFVSVFSARAARHFGSGWTWLCSDASGKLEIITTPNQDNPLMLEGPTAYYPILGLDLWEHAYYLNYQNRRADYIEAFWKIVSWPKVEARYLAHLG